LQSIKGKALNKSKLWIIGTILIFTLLPFYKLTFMQGVVITDDIFASDLMNDRYPLRYFLGTLIKEGRLPLWVPHIYGGFPLFAAVEVGSFYPPNLIFFGLFEPLIALNLDILFHIFLTGVFTYLYARSLKMERVSALFSGLILMYSGFFISHMKQLNMVNAACYVPLLFFMIERYCQKGQFKYLLYFSLVLGIQILAGHPQITYYTILGSIAYFCFRLKSTLTIKQFLPRLCFFSLTIGIGFAVGAIQLIPTFELSSLSQRSGGVPYQFATSCNYHPYDILTFLYPFINGNPGTASYKLGTYKVGSVFWEDYGYVGLIPLFLALYLIASTFYSRKITRVHTFFLICSFFLVLGAATPFFKIFFYLVPGMNYFRFPTRFLLFTDFSLAILAGMGFSKLFIRRSFFISGIIFLLTLADLWFFQVRQNPVIEMEKWGETPETAKYLQQDQGLFRIFSPHSKLTHIFAFREANGWEGDLSPYLEQRSVLQPSSNILSDLATCDGYINLTPQYLLKIWGDEKVDGEITKTYHLSPDGKEMRVDEGFIKIVSLFNAKYILSWWPIHHPALREVFRSGKTIIYLNQQVFPRCFVVPHSLVIQDDDESVRFLFSEKFSPKETVILSENPEGMQEETAVFRDALVEVKEYNPTGILLRVKMQSPGFLVTSDTYYPGWKVEIDGKRGRIYRANVCQRAIYLPVGDHEVRFFFAPSSLTLGFVVSSFALLLVVVLLRVRRDKA
jgi:hypothetical protein